MQTHHLKTWPQFYYDIETGHKPFEVRLNDRNFQVGDTLILEEYDPQRGYTGRKVSRTVTYVLDVTGLEALKLDPATEDLVIMGLSRNWKEDLVLSACNFWINIGANSLERTILSILFFAITLLLISLAALLASTAPGATIGVLATLYLAAKFPDLLR